MDNNEEFYKNICEKCVKTMDNEMLLKKGSGILHIYIEDDFIDLKLNGEINIDNYENYLDSNYNIYHYNSYKELFEQKIKYDIFTDIKEIGVFDFDKKWGFYLTFEELQKLDYGFMIKNEYPLLQKYVLEEKYNDFFKYFSLEQLNAFEKTLDLYYESNYIDFNDKAVEIYSKSNADFNSNIIYLSEGLLSYEDFIEGAIYDISTSVVTEYFKENGINNLMEYGSDCDEGLYHLTSMYQEIMDRLNIKYENIYTKDGVSGGKYVTTITLDNDIEMNLDTCAWDKIEDIVDNIESVYEYIYKIKNKLINIFKEEYNLFPENNGMIPANSSLLNNYSLGVVYDLVKEGILQERNCSGLAFEFTDEYIKQIENETEENEI